MFGIFRKRKNQPIKLETMNEEALLLYITLNMSGVSVVDFIKHLRPISITGLKRVCNSLSVPCSIGESKLLVLQRLHSSLNKG